MVVLSVKDHSIFCCEYRMFVWRKGGEDGFSQIAVLLIMPGSKRMLCSTGYPKGDLAQT